MTTDSNDLRRELRRAGLSEKAIDAAWPTWWSEELADDPSGRAELRFALARRLGLSPKSLLGERVRFVWNDEARFKHLSAEDVTHRAALASFGMTVGGSLLRATPEVAGIVGVTAADLRAAILRDRAFVDLQGLVFVCWAVGLPLVHLRVFPLDAKAMHAMVVGVDGRQAILLGRDAPYPAQTAFTLAHELGHVALGHLEGAPALVDMDDPAKAGDKDEEETAADRFALELLTGTPTPTIDTDGASYNAPGLARAVEQAAPRYRIEPGTLALCLAYQTGQWGRAMSALEFIYGAPRRVWRDVNTLAASQLRWEWIGDDAAEWIRTVTDIRD
ncbi:protein of unknown function [Sphingomonas guangdongensis]|uniref:IrrE N-terminal-like domain-containing protein n=1 Tax=Sphingomonas guangdongensis TaxID=1141890 RepID=A0A285QFT8_9SPHN|nr:ImmA/IrrE family metallo-endopeptidase [Sphingomonas guangdongensis]SOB80696.1 protein of unknown function [Sphingomonas guangdongensis]